MAPRKRILPIFIPHLGCPYQCVFCNQNSITGTDYSATAESMIHTLEQSGCRTDASCEKEPYELAFFGGSFTAIPEHVQREFLSVVQPYRTSGWIRSIRCSTRPDAISDENLAMLNSFGVDTVELGCQSMDDEVLNLSGRGHTSDDVIRASEKIRQHGMNLIVQMMTGLPGDSREKDIHTAKELIALCPDGVRIYPTVILRDTELFYLWKDHRYEEHTVEMAVSICSEIVPMFQQNCIPIIRLGLNPSEDLSDGKAAGGAYHPAFGELVYSRIMLNKARNQLKDSLDAEEVVQLRVAPSFVSKMTGIRRRNLFELSEAFPNTRFRVISDSNVEEWDVVVSLQKD